VRNQSLDKLVDIMSLCFSQDDPWVAAGRNAGSTPNLPRVGYLDANQVRSLFIRINSLDTKDAMKDARRPGNTHGGHIRTC